MDIQKTIETLLTNTADIKKHYPTVDNVRHNIYDVPYSELRDFALENRLTLHTDSKEQRAYVIYAPLVNGAMDIDIWIYSGIVKIKPAEIIEL